MSALAFPAEPEYCHCDLYDSTKNVWTGHDCELLNEIYFDLVHNKIYHLNSKRFLTYLVTELMRSSPFHKYSDVPNLQDAYAPVMREMVSVIDGQIGS